MAITFYGCNKENKLNTDINNDIVEKTDDENLNIITTNKLLYYMTKTIAKDKHIIDYMYKDSFNEHKFIYTKDSVNNISKQDLFIHNDTNIEPWLGDFTNKINKGKVGSINVCRGINLISYSKKIKYKDFEQKYNPYYWLNLDNYKIALLNIKNSIQDKDPKNRSYYEKNFSAELKKLEELEQGYKKISNDLKKYHIFCSEEQLDYMIKYCSLNAKKLNNITTIDELSKQQGNKDIKFIFLYNNDNELKIYKDIIKKYNMKVVKVQLFGKDNMTVMDVLKANLKVLEQIK